MADWATISSLATAGGTLILAVASFASIRSADRAALSAERAVQASLRPVLISSRVGDPDQKLIWMDGHGTRLHGGAGYVQVEEDRLYLAASLRNVGPGIGVIHGWRLAEADTYASRGPADPESFRRQSRDLYVAPGDTGFWHAAIREATDPDHAPILQRLKNRERISIDLLYGDHEGGQRTVSRFALIPHGAEGTWYCQVVRHWNLDRPDPR
ncbi:hypothetical protein P3T36_000790 [Kitasatospora sp. MAP12-15]|uniref:hypothetical protein n=1 Tax=unclassified Kitasatospora TaxID=2633591 RepID=UPI002474704E|nr:hypothetical protein [Kitasatospora sp. MAP12-44]MDH6114389.1 hypothetical protein [Kitasatospora sp. MAP12-44]